MNKKVFKPVVSALFAAIICVATFLIQIPIAATGGYINMGDCFVILSGYVLGPVYGFLSAAIGSALADLLFGYVAYIPATFIIKGVMALLIALFAAKFKCSTLNIAFFAAFCEFIMILGYFIYECFVLSYGLAALYAIPGNIFQGVFAVFASIILIQIIEKNIKLKKLIDWRE